MQATPLLLLTAFASAPPVDEMLRRAGAAVENFWQQFSAVTCTETVSQAKLGEHGKTLDRLESSFDYLVMLQSAGADLTVEESRVPIKEYKNSKNLPMLVTNGFSTLALVFHPMFQGSYEFSHPEPETVDGRSLLKISFQQAKGGRSPSALLLRKREFPLEWRGTAWLDPESGAIVKIEAGLKTAMDDVGLKTLHAAVRYMPMKFSEDPAVHWLPVEATVEAETPHQHWLNVHRFSNYKHFSVQTKSSTEAPKTP